MVALFKAVHLIYSVERKTYVVVYKLSILYLITCTKYRFVSYDIK